MSNITKDDADKLQKLQLQTIIEKVKAGKTLTASERKMLDAASEEPAEKKLITQTELTKLFGITRKTFSQWRREGRNIPAKVNGKEDLNAWRSWFAANPDAGHWKGKGRADKESLQCELLQIKIEQEKIELKIAQGEVFDAQHVRDRDYMVSLLMREALLKLRNEMPPLCEGRTATELITVFEDFTNRTLKMLHDNHSELWDEALKKWEAREKLDSDP